jgi:hypothetical protein
VEQQDIDQYTLALPCASKAHFPFDIATTKREGGVMFNGNVRIESAYAWDGCGGRTDLHDVFGLGWAASLRASGAASSSVWGVEGWSGAPELNSRVLFFDQPYNSALSECEFESHRRRLFAHTAWAAHDLADAFGFCSPQVQPPKWNDARPPTWVLKLDGVVRAADKGLWVTRRNPDWEYFVDVNNSVSIVKLSRRAREFLNHLFAFYKPSAVRSGDNYIFSANGLNNCVPVAVADRAIEILQRVEGRLAAKWRGPASAPTDNAILVIPVDSHCIFIGARSMIALTEPCGLEEFDSARMRWTQHSAMEASIFNAKLQWRWAAKLNPGRFEQLVEALLSEEPGLHWVRAAGPAFERDQGRDLVAMWLTPPGLGQRLTEDQAEQPIQMRKILVQVKVRSRTVGKGDVQDVRDTLERHSADGFLLVTHPGWSNDLFNYCETLASQGYWVNLFGPSQLEERLRRRVYVANRFPDLVTRVPNESEV